MKNMYQVLTKSRRITAWILAIVFGAMAVGMALIDQEIGLVMAISFILLAIVFFTVVLVFPLQRLKKDARRLMETYGYDPEEEWYSSQQLEKWLYISEHFVYGVSTATVVCKEDIASVNLMDGQGASIQADMKLANGKKRSLVLSSASLDVISAWMEGRTLQEARAVEPSQRTQALQDQKANMKKVIPFVLAMVGMVAIFSVGYAFISDMRQQQEEEEQQQQAYENNPKVQDYESYLRNVKGDEDDITMYVDQLDEGELLTFVNQSDHFFSGDFVLSKEDYKTTDRLSVSMMRPHSYQFQREDVDNEATSYRIENGKFQAFDYPNVSFSYMLEIGLNEEYTWYDIALSDANCTMDNIRKMMAYEYAVNEVIQEKESTFYMYDESHRSYDQYEFYDPESCRYAAIVDLGEKKIEIYENQDGKMVFMESISMNEGGNQ